MQAPATSRYLCQIWISNSSDQGWSRLQCCINMQLLPERPASVTSDESR